MWVLIVFRETCSSFAISVSVSTSWSAGSADRLRRYFRLTRDGRHALAQEAELRAATARVVRLRLGLAGGEAAG